MVKQKKKKRKKDLQKDVLTSNRWGCGCVILLFMGLILAMIYAGMMQ